MRVRSGAEPAVQLSSRSRRPIRCLRGLWPSWRSPRHPRAWFREGHVAGPLRPLNRTGSRQKVGARSENGIYNVGREDDDPGRVRGRVLLDPGWHDGLRPEHAQRNTRATARREVRPAARVPAGTPREGPALRRAEGSRSAVSRRANGFFVRYGYHEKLVGSGIGLGGGYRHDLFDRRARIDRRKAA